MYIKTTDTTEIHAEIIKLKAKTQQDWTGSQTNI